MERIIDERGTGKTSKLLAFAKQIGADVVCSNPRGMEYKAEKYGIQNINFLSYDEFSTILNHSNDYVIDDLEEFIKSAFGQNLKGYTITTD